MKVAEPEQARAPTSLEIIKQETSEFYRFSSTFSREENRKNSVANTIMREES